MSLVVYYNPEDGFEILGCLDSDIKMMFINLMDTKQTFWAFNEKNNAVSPKNKKTSYYLDDLYLIKKDFDIVFNFLTRNNIFLMGLFVYIFDEIDLSQRGNRGSNINVISTNGFINLVHHHSYFYADTEINNLITVQQLKEIKQWMLNKLIENNILKQTMMNGNWVFPSVIVDETVKNIKYKEPNKLYNLFLVFYEFIKSSCLFLTNIIDGYIDKNTDYEYVNETNNKLIENKQINYHVYYNALLNQKIYIDRK